MKTRKIQLFLGAAVCAMLMTACSGTQNSSGTASVQASQEMEESQTESSTENVFTYDSKSAPVSTVLMAKVNAISGNVITLSVGGGAPKDENSLSGNQPGGNHPDGNQPSGNFVPGDQPGGDQQGGGQPGGDQQGGGQPGGDQQGGDKPSGDKPSGDKPSGDQDSATLIIQDESQISISDIKVDSYLKITFDENSKITSIEISDAPEQKSEA